MRILIILLLLCSCGKHEVTPEVEVTDSVFSHAYKVEGTLTKGRVIYIHYLNGNADSMDVDTFGDIKYGIIAKGYQVISINTPHIDSNTYADGGDTYLNNYIEFLDWLISDINDKYGYADTIIGGVSFGGIHTLMAVIERPEYFDRYFTVVGITDVTTLPLYRGQEVNSFNANYSKDRLLGKSGFMVWGSNDTVTDNNLTVSLQQYLSDTVVGHEVLGTWHSVEQEHVTKVLEWFDTF